MSQAVARSAAPVSKSTSVVYLAGGCLWGVQAFVRTLPGVTATEAGRANGTSRTLDGEYDGYAECVRTEFDPGAVTVGVVAAAIRPRRASVIESAEFAKPVKFAVPVAVVELSRTVAVNVPVVAGLTVPAAHANSIE